MLETLSKQFLDPIRRKETLGTINELFHHKLKWDGAIHHSLITQFNERRCNSSTAEEIINYSILI